MAERERFGSQVQRTIAAAVLLMSALLAGGAEAAFVVINNGLAPPAPTNVLDDATFIGDSINVRNVGCPPLWPAGFPSDPCPAPGVATGLAIDPGAVVGGFVRAFETSTIEMVGGTVGGSMMINDFSGLELSGGTLLGDLKALQSASVLWSGGQIVESLYAYDSSLIAIVGSGFAVDGVPVGFGDLEASAGFLTGTLASGEPIANEFQQRETPILGTITLVPDAPTADVRVNGQDGFVSVAAGDLVTFRISFLASTAAGGPGETYVALVFSGGLLWITAGGPSGTPAPLFTGPLADLPSTPLLAFPAIPGFIAMVLIVDDAEDGVPMPVWLDVGGYVAP